MTFKEKLKNFAHSTRGKIILCVGLVTALLVGGTKYRNTPRINDDEIYVKRKHTEMQTDPESGKKFKAYIIETSAGNFECDAFYKQFTKASRDDAEARYNAIELYHDYKITSVKKGNMAQPGILDLRQTGQKLHLDKFE